MTVYDCLQHVCDFYCLEGLLPEREVKDYQNIFKNVKMGTGSFGFEANLSNQNTNLDFSMKIFPENQKHIVEEVKFLGWCKVSEILRFWIKNRNLFEKEYCWIEFDHDATLKEKIEPNIFISLDINNKVYDTKN